MLAAPQSTHFTTIFAFFNFRYRWPNGHPLTITFFFASHGLHFWMILIELLRLKWGKIEVISSVINWAIYLLTNMWKSQLTFYANFFRIISSTKLFEHLQKKWFENCPLVSFAHFASDSMWAKMRKCVESSKFLSLLTVYRQSSVVETILRLILLFVLHKKEERDTITFTIAIRHIQTLEKK